PPGDRASHPLLPPIFRGQTVRPLGCWALPPGVQPHRPGERRVGDPAGRTTPQRATGSTHRVNGRDSYHEAHGLLAVLGVINVHVDIRPLPDPASDERRCLPYAYP